MQITRRRLGQTLGAVSALGTRTSSSAELPTVRLGNAAGIIDPQLIYMTMGQHPRLHYYRDEGCQLEIINMAGSGQTMQAILGGNCETSSLAPIVFLGVYAKNPSTDLIYPYVWLREPHWAVAVKPDSKVQSLADLKGKTIGIRNQGDTGYVAARYMLAELGIDPDNDVEWLSVGEGGPAGAAIYHGQVDAMAFWDGAFARIELAGFALRYLPNSPNSRHMFSQAYAVRKSDLPAHRDLYVRFFRANAKSTVFAYANPDLAIKLHWELYPESMPKGKSPAEALADARHIVDSRKDKWMPQSWQADKRFGAGSTAEWEAQVRFAGLSNEIKDVTPIFTNDLLDEINAFDRDAIVAQAKSMTM